MQMIIKMKMKALYKDSFVNRQLIFTPAESKLLSNFHTNMVFSHYGCGHSCEVPWSLLAVSIWLFVGGSGLTVNVINSALKDTCLRTDKVRFSILGQVSLLT